MPEFHTSPLLLSCLMPSDRACEIVGDLAEEASGKPRGWLWCNYLIVVSQFFYQRIKVTPLWTAMMAALTMLAAAMVTLFLLIPFSLIHLDMQVVPVMAVVFILRALACFVVAVVLSDAYGRRVSPGIIMASLLMMPVLVLRLYALDQGVWLPAANLMGPVQHVFFYLVCSSLPLLAGCLYGHYSRHYRLGDQGQVA